MRKWWWYGAACLVMGVQGGGAVAQPRLDKPMALQPDAVAVGIRGGQLQQWLLPAPHREMAYRIRMWVPAGPAPQGGWPVVYMLDGDAAFESLITTAQRLPSAPVPRHASINPQKQMVWGHSYGGLAVLYLLERHAAAFQHFVSVSPSLWWHRQSYAERLIHASAQTVPMGTRLTLFDGGDTEPPHTLALNQRLKQALAQWPGLRLDEQAFPGVSHGQMFPDGLAAALQAYLR